SRARLVGSAKLFGPSPCSHGAPVRTCIRIENALASRHVNASRFVPTWGVRGSATLIGSSATRSQQQKRAPSPISGDNWDQGLGEVHHLIMNREDVHRPCHRAHSPLT